MKLRSVLLLVLSLAACEAPTSKPLSDDTATRRPWPVSSIGWFVDPQNVTGNANDSNTCTTQTAPCAHFSGIVAHWGTNAPHLRDTTTVTFLSNHSDTTDPVEWRPSAENGAAPILAGALGAAQTIATGTLGTVTPKNRGAHQLLQADFGVVLPPNTLIMNSTRASCAWTYRTVSGTVMSLTQPLNNETPPAPLRGSEVDTWAAGDSFTAFTPVQVNVVDFEPIITDEATRDGVGYLVDVTVLDPGGVGVDTLYVNNGVRIYDSLVQRASVSTSPESLPNGSSYGWRSSVALGSVYMSTSVNWAFYAGAMRGVANELYYPDLEFDAISEKTTIAYGLLTNSGFYIEGSGSTWILPLYGMIQGPVWGPGKLLLNAEVRVAYSSTASAQFLQTGGFTMNGSSTACAVVSGAWTCGIALTPANLDAPPPAGFGGFATEPGGAALIAGTGGL